MLWVLRGFVSLRQFFWVTKTHNRNYRQEILKILHCISFYDSFNGLLQDLSSEGVTGKSNNKKQLLLSSELSLPG